MLKITALLENKTIDSSLVCYPGLSLLLEDGDNKIIFDTGSDTQFIDNAKKMNIDLHDVKTIVISHGHYDHFGGLTKMDNQFFQQKPTVISHPDILYTRRAALFLGKQAIKFKSLSPTFDAKMMKEKFNFKLSQQPLKIDQRFIYAGEVTQRVVKKKYGILQKEAESVIDYVRDDSFIVWIGEEGLVIITGCSHSGIESIINHAKKITKQDKIQAIVGGLHLRCASPAALIRAKKQIDKETKVYGCHCTGSLGRIFLRANDFNTGQILYFR